MVGGLNDPPITTIRLRLPTASFSIGGFIGVSPQNVSRLHKRKSEQVFAAPAVRIVDSRIANSKANAPNAVVWARLDQQRVPSSEKERTKFGILRELRQRTAQDDVGFPSVHSRLYFIFSSFCDFLALHFTSYLHENFPLTLHPLKL